jgi:glycosyltransferase involved in cell wall biosynthesis
VLRILRDKNIKFKMLYIGDGPDRRRLEDKIREYNLEDRVILCGKVMDRELLKAIYYRSYLFLFPSLFDASSLVQIEAASQKVPTIFLEGSKTSSDIINRVNGFIVKDEVEFADTIDEVMNDEELYHKVSEGAYRDVYKNWDKVVKDVYEMYLKYIGER